MVTRTTPTASLPPNTPLSRSSSLPSKDSAEYFHAKVKEADRLHDLGIDLCYASDRHEEALQALYLAVDLREALLGKFHPDTALSYSRIASIQHEYRHNSYEALVAGRRELRISQDLLKGEGRSSIAEVDETKEPWMVVRLEWFEQVLENVGELSGNQKKRYCSQLLQSIAMEQLGDQHASIKEWELAVTHYNNALTVESNTYGRNVIDAAELHVKTAECLIRMKDYEGALDELTNAERKYRQAFSLDAGAMGGGCTPQHHHCHPHRAVGDVYRKMAALSLLQNNFDDALASYAKAYAIFEDTYGTTHQRSRDVLADIKLVTVREMEQIRRDEMIRRKKGSKLKAPSS
jgi:tetratricopeptide (TPR) repeat protein